MKFWLIAAVLLMSSPPAKGEEIPFVLEENRGYKNIPDNQGVSFFYGVWSLLSEGSIDFNLKITPTQLRADKLVDFVLDYRVLTEASNYVLLLTRRQTRENEVFNSFSVLAIFNRWKEDANLKTAYPYMRLYTCSPFNIYRNPKAFQLSKKRIMATFKNSDCMSNIDSSNAIKSIDRIDRIGDFWSIHSYKYTKDNSPKSQ